MSSWEYGYTPADYDDSASYWRRQRRGKNQRWYYEYFEDDQIVAALRDAEELRKKLKQNWEKLTKKVLDEVEARL